MTRCPLKAAIFSCGQLPAKSNYGEMFATLNPIKTSLIAFLLTQDKQEKYVKRIQAKNLKSIKFGFVQTFDYSESCFVVCCCCC
jgi:hypothetical protein